MDYYGYIDFFKIRIQDLFSEDELHRPPVVALIIHINPY